MLRRAFQHGIEVVFGLLHFQSCPHT
jgi:hypothetical protein